MAAEEEKTPPSLSALVEQTARILRRAADSNEPKSRSISKKSPLTSSNRIQKIASILRSEAKKTTDNQ